MSNREETTLGGLNATRADLELGENDCSAIDEVCVVLGTNQLAGWKDLVPGSKYSIWLVDQGSEDPILVVVGINRATDAAWFDTADRVLATLAFGDVGPNPVLLAMPGSIEMPFLGGIRTELAQEAMVVDDPVGRIALLSDPADTEFLTNPLDLDGNTLESADQVVTVLAQSNTEVRETEPAVVGGLEARVFELGSSSSPPTLKLTPKAEGGWRPPPRGRMWLIEHPDRGLLMITAEGFADVDRVFPLVLAQTELVIQSLEFVELG